MTKPIPGVRTRGASRGAILATILTAVVGGFALAGVSTMPVIGASLFPGSMAAWLFRGDNYTSSHEFLVFAIAFGVPINAAIGALLGWAFVDLRARFAGEPSS